MGSSNANDTFYTGCKNSSRKVRVQYNLSGLIFVVVDQAMVPTFFGSSLFTSCISQDRQDIDFGDAVADMTSIHTLLSSKRVVRRCRILVIYVKKK